MNEKNTNEKPSHFIRDIIAEEVAAGKNGGEVVTRFPPEPNGYLHIGHAKAICLDFGMAKEFNGRCHLRMDDTNPAKEDMEYVEAIKEDVRWLGFDWGDNFHFAADYFERMFDVACNLIANDKAYVCELSSEEWKEYRGVPTRPGKESPTRNRSPEENLDLFKRMRAGEFPDNSLCLRAKIDMASPNMHLRDPVIYRIMRAHHYRTNDDWCIYPMYDFAHPLEDAFEGITHSLCTLEFEVHRPLYDWVIANIDIERKPRQIEFARLNLTYTIMSKRKLLSMVTEKNVSGWDDPRMPTVSGMRRRGYPAAAIRNFCETVGITKFKSMTELALLENAVRSELNETSLRRMAVFNPLKVIIENAEDLPASVKAANNPGDESAGERDLEFGSEIYIDREDFEMVPPPKFHRLTPGKSVRIRFAGYLTCTSADTGDDGNVTAVRCTWTPPTEKMKVKGTIHWVPASAPEAKVRLYDKLFTVEEPDADDDVSFTEHINPESLTVITARIEPALVDAKIGAPLQFERIGYFTVDAKDSTPDNPVFNRTVTLKDFRPKN